MADKDIEFVDGLYFNERRDNAPDWVLGSISVRPDEFMGWLGGQTPDDKGYVKIAIRRSKAGKAYCVLDDWKPQTQGKPRF